MCTGLQETIGVHEFSGRLFARGPRCQAFLRLWTRWAGWDPDPGYVTFRPLRLPVPAPPCARLTTTVRPSLIRADS